MRNIFLSLGAGVAVFAVFYVPGILRLGEAIPPGVLGLMVAYFLLARRTFRKVEAMFNDAAKSLQSMPPKFDLAISTLEKAYPYGREQLGVKSQVDAQIGVIHFLRQDFTKALPYLESSLGFGHWVAGAMLAVVHYKKKNHDEMRRVLKIVARRGKKQALVWCLHAYLLLQLGLRDEAQGVLIEGVRKTKGEAKVKDALLDVQNNRKIRMRAFKEQWYQFHLERPPVEYQQTFVPGGKMSKAARRGRWM